MREKVFSYQPFMPNGGTRTLEVREAEKLYKDVRADIPDCVALHGSRIYGKPRRSSDLDVLEIYYEGKVAYEHLMSDGIEISILKAPRDKIELDIESDACGNYLTTKFCRINKPLYGEKDILEFKELALHKLFIEGLKKMKNQDGIFITPSYGMKLITTMRMWYEPQRWWSIYSSFIDCPEKKRNIAIYYDLVEKVMVQSEYLDQVESYNGEKLFVVDGLEREPPKIREWIGGLYLFAKAQFSASDLWHIFREMYPKVYGLNMAVFYGSLRYPELFRF